jgi:hypothetical protein
MVIANFLVPNLWQFSIVLMSHIFLYPTNGGVWHHQLVNFYCSSLLREYIGILHSFWAYKTLPIRICHWTLEGFEF